METHHCTAPENENGCIESGGALDKFCTFCSLDAMVSCLECDQVDHSNLIALEEKKLILCVCGMGHTW